MANRFNLPRVTALDSNGDPISGAKLNFYESGTTTRLDTYSDTALSSANANPLVADSAGRFGEIFLQASDYKVVLTDADDVTIWTADPVAGTIDVTGDDYAPSQQSVADMTVLVAGGSQFDAVSKTLVTNAAQTSPLITAPSSNPRKDIIYIDRLTGVVGVQTGTEAASPLDPTIADGKLPVARVTLATTTTEITDSLIDDIRHLENLGDLGGEHIQNQTFNYATDSGVADAYEIALTPAIKAYATGQRFGFRAANANTGNSTLVVDGIGVDMMKKLGSGGWVNLDAGDIVPSQLIEVIRSSAFFKIVSPLATIGTSLNIQIFDSDGTWTKPSGAKSVHVQAWGGGGSGAKKSGGAAYATGGGGGGYDDAWFDASDLGATESVVVGTGGPPATSDPEDGVDGEDSTFGSFITAGKGVGGVKAGSGTGAGGDGGDGVPASYNAGAAFEGAAGVDDANGASSYRGGASGGGASTVAAGYIGGNSVWAGAGGGGAGNNDSEKAGGTSLHGGDGGFGSSTASTATDGTAPGGGGGGLNNVTGNSGAGADGRIIVTTYF